MRKISFCLALLFILVALSMESACVFANTNEDYDDGNAFELDYSASTFDMHDLERAFPTSFNFGGVICSLVLDAGVRTTSGAAVTVYTANEELPLDVIKFYDKETLNNYDVVLISPASAWYNCHSYAWHLTASTNTYCIVDISAYLDDPHCTEIESAVVGAIVVYYDSNGYPSHSAIVTEIIGDSVICRSKWGPSGVYEHELRTVPNDYKANGQIDVKYYLYEKVHSFAYSYDASASYHVVNCTTCAYQSTETHNCRVTYNTATHTRTCRYCGWSATEAHALDLITNKCTVCSYNASNTPVQPVKTNTKNVAIGIVQ